MPVKRVVVVGASSGGLEAMRAMVAAFPPGLPAAVCVVLHTAPESPGILAGILTRSGPLPASKAGSGERLQPGRIYVAPPDHHLMVEPDALLITRGPKENRFRPAIDPLFRSAAQVYGPAAIGIILTGNLDDGAAGLWAVKRMGGTAIVQDPQEALFPSMPQSAIRHVHVDYVVPLAKIAPLVTDLVTAPVSQWPASAAPPHLDVESAIARR
jgi:two-component system chemotaxis response regulator CheB